MTLMICSFCPAEACEGLTILPACEAHWDNPEGAATALECRARDAEAALAEAQARIARLEGALADVSTELFTVIERSRSDGVFGEKLRIALRNAYTKADEARAILAETAEAR